MSDRPILFSAPMVRALLDGRKTQTRRLLGSVRVFGTPETKAFTLKGANLQRALQNASGFRHLNDDGWFWEADAFEWQQPATRTGWMAHIGYAPGDRLWAKEAVEKANGEAIGYPADGTWLPNTPWTWKNRSLPSMYMPRHLSRITLIVDDVRVERLQDISEADAIAEGVDLDAAARHGWGQNKKWIEGHCRDCEGWDPVTEWKTAACGFRHGDERDYRPRYSSGAGCSYGFKLRTTTELKRFQYPFLWNSLHEKPGERWEDNPWIVAISFDVVRGNIDEVAT